MSRIKQIAVVFVLALSLIVGVVSSADTAWACGSNGGSCPCPGSTTC